MKTELLFSHSSINQHTNIHWTENLTTIFDNIKKLNLEIPNKKKNIIRFGQYIILIDLEFKDEIKQDIVKGIMYFFLNQDELLENHLSKAFIFGNDDNEIALKQEFRDSSIRLDKRILELKLED